MPFFEHVQKHSPTLPLIPINILKCWKYVYENILQAVKYFSSSNTLSAASQCNFHQYTSKRSFCSGHMKSKFCLGPTCLPT